MNHHRRRGFRPRPQKNGFRRRNNPQDHASQVYNISSKRNFKRNSLNPAQIEKTISKYQQLSKDAQSAGDPILSEKLSSACRALFKKTFRNKFKIRQTTAVKSEYQSRERYGKFRR